MLECTNAISKLLQETTIDLLQASELLQSSIRTLQEYREQFDEAKASTLALAVKWGCNSQFTATRVKKVKRHFDDLSEDSRLSDAEHYFRVNVF